MYPRKFLFCVAAFGLATAANAEVVTANLAAYSNGTNISNAFPGVALRKLRQLTGTTYSPTLLSVLKGTCNYGGCTSMSAVSSMGGNAYLAGEYHDCLNGSPWACSGYEVLQATFTNPTNFVEFEFSWIVDPPVIYGYDAAGNEIASCLALGGPSSIPAGCALSYSVSPGGEGIGTIRLSSLTNNIKRVVTGSNAGSSRVTGLQYNRL